MSSKAYKPQQLLSVVDSVLKKNVSGVLNLNTQTNSLQRQRSGLLIFSDGALVYGGTKIPQATEFCQYLGKTLKSNLFEQALTVAQERAKNPDSAIELLELLIRMRTFTWQSVESLMNNQVMLNAEKFLPYSGEAKWVSSNEFELYYGQDQHGLDWEAIQKELELRRPKWKSLEPQISSMDVVPHVNAKQLQLIDNPEVKTHLQNLVDGNSSLVDIAEKMGRDPLKVAKSYLNWCHNGWVSFDDGSKARSVASVSTSQAPSDQATNRELPIVLSVDDSPIIQTCIKRALQSDYQVMLASKAEEARKILNEVRVELMLLDLTMPDVDGLEFCKEIRNIPKFKNLPVVMVTARDGLVNKMRGHIAGSSKYITKPFEADELKEVVGQYLKK